MTTADAIRAMNAIASMNRAGDSRPDSLRKARRAYLDGRIDADELEARIEGILRRNRSSLGTTCSRSSSTTTRSQI